jgi:hypothetical protein
MSVQAGSRTTASLLNQYYGQSDAVSSVVTAASFTNLSSVYTIPANEAAYAGAAYELRCGGNGTWGSTQQELDFAVSLNGGTFGAGKGGDAASTAFAASIAFLWGVTLTVVCVDGVSSWKALLEVRLQASGSAATSSSAFPLVCVASPSSVPAASAVTVALAAKWNTTTGAPTITNQLTTFRKIA